MIEIGLCGWGDHSELYREASASRGKLPIYAKWFRVVEVDSTFYALWGRLWVVIRINVG